MAAVFALGVAIGLMFVDRSVRPPNDPPQTAAGGESHPRFIPDGQALKIINITNPLGYAIAKGGAYPTDPYVAGWSTIDAAMPGPLLEELRMVGFTAVRLVVDPAPLLAADDAARQALLDKITASVAHILARDMKCIVDIHPSPTPMVAGYASTDLVDGPAGPNFARLVAVEQALASRLERMFPADKIAFELFNEPPPISRRRLFDSWPKQLLALYQAVRASAPGLTLVLTGADYASIDGLVALDPDQFDRNTIFSFHDYHPMVFTHQSIPPPSVEYGIQYVSRLAFPPDPRQEKDVVAAAVARLNADSRLQPDEKPKLEKQLRGVLAAYFEKPQNQDWIARRFDSVTTWADRHGVHRARLLLGEFGAWGDFKGQQGADLESRAAYIGYVRRLAEKLGMSWGVWELQNPTTAWSFVAADRRPEPALARALFD